MNAGTKPCGNETANKSAAAQPRQLIVGDVMTSQPTCVRPESTVLDLVQTFHAKQFRHLLVTDENERLMGVVSDRDVVRCFGPTVYPDESMLASIPTRKVMSRDVVTIDRSTPLVECIDMLRREGVSCLPVVEDERLVGIITTSDLLRCLRQMLV